MPTAAPSLTWCSHSMPSLVSLARLTALFWRAEGTTRIFPLSTTSGPRAEARIHATDGDYLVSIVYGLGRVGGPFTRPVATPSSCAAALSMAPRISSYRGAIRSRRRGAS
jgi:hypothetical protein